MPRGGPALQTGSAQIGMDIPVGRGSSDGIPSALHEHRFGFMSYTSYDKFVSARADRPSHLTNGPMTMLVASVYRTFNWLMPGWQTFGAKRWHNVRCAFDGLVERK